MKTLETAALVVKRTLPFPPEEVFRAFSDPVIMSRWFYGFAEGRSEVSLDFRKGGEFSILMLSAKGNAYPHNGVYKEIVPGEKIVFTWNSAVAKDSVVTVSFRKVPEGSEVTLVHEFLADDMKAKHDEGWNCCLDNLAKELGSGARKG